MILQLRGCSKVRRKPRRAVRLGLVQRHLWEPPLDVDGRAWSSNSPTGEAVDPNLEGGVRSAQWAGSSSWTHATPTAASTASP
jgi:hypothetical protein